MASIPYEEAVPRVPRWEVTVRGHGLWPTGALVPGGCGRRSWGGNVSVRRTHAVVEHTTARDRINSPVRTPDYLNLATYRKPSMPLVTLLWCAEAHGTFSIDSLVTVARLNGYGTILRSDLCSAVCAATSRAMGRHDSRGPRRTRQTAVQLLGQRMKPSSPSLRS
jgi:hypothetical protein